MIWLRSAREEGPLPRQCKSASTLDEGPGEVVEGGKGLWSSAALTKESEVRRRVVERVVMRNFILVHYHRCNGWKGCERDREGILKLGDDKECIHSERSKRWWCW